MGHPLAIDIMSLTGHRSLSVLKADRLSNFSFICIVEKNFRSTYAYNKIYINMVHLIELLKYMMKNTVFDSETAGFQTITI